MIKAVKAVARLHVKHLHHCCVWFGGGTIGTGIGVPSYFETFGSEEREQKNLDNEQKLNKGKKSKSGGFAVLPDKADVEQF